MSTGIDTRRSPGRILKINDTSSGMPIYISFRWIVAAEVVSTEPTRILVRLGMDKIQMKRGTDLMPIVEMTGADADNLVNWLETNMEGNYDGNLYTDQLPPP